MSVKYGTAEHVEVVKDKAVISDKKLETKEAEKVASGKSKKRVGSKRSVVADKDFKRTDEDHIPGD